MDKPSQNIKHDPTIEKVLSRMPEDIADSFNDEQLMHLRNAIGAREWGSHAVDFRGTFKFPLVRWRYYYVLLLGRNYRDLSRKEKQFALLATAFFTALFLIFSTLLGILILYLLKSAAGIDIFPNFSFGVWGWFKGLWA